MRHCGSITKRHLAELGAPGKLPGEDSWFRQRQVTKLRYKARRWAMRGTCQQFTAVRRKCRVRGSDRRFGSSSRMGPVMKGLAWEAREYGCYLHDHLQLYNVLSFGKIISP